MSEPVCESCGHAPHHSVVPAVACSNTCPCPSTRPASPECACKGEMPWLREHSYSSCDNDYPCNDPNVCHFTWEGMPKEALRQGQQSHPMHCHKRKGHRGPHSTHNDCGKRLENHSVCGEAATASGYCSKHSCALHEDCLGNEELGLACIQTRPQTQALDT